MSHAGGGAAAPPPGESDSCPWKDASLLRWSSAGSWPDGAVPANGASIVLTQPILLDTDTARLDQLEIQKGGRLVFSPAAPLTLTAHSIRMTDGGSLVVGNEECEYPARRTSY